MLVVANWKAYVEDVDRAKNLFMLSKRLAATTHTTIVLGPAAPFLSILTRNNRSPVAFAAQDVSRTTGGAKTGEITAQAYAGAGATYAIIGHSERRAAGDTDAIVSEKLVHALAHGLRPILCVGERARDADGRYLSLIREELVRALEPLTPKERGEVIIAYEPLWAIGQTADSAIVPNDLGEMVLYIRKVVAELLPEKRIPHTQVLYGGSVEVSNVRALAASTSVDGFLVGRSSVDPKIFTLLVKQLN